LPLFPRGIGVVTSLDAAALHDVVAALRRRLPHVPVVLSAASVQGANAASELVHALQELFDRVTVDSLSPTADAGKTRMPIDVILLVRGGGSIEDLWPFNDERLARALARSPVPVISGVGHETDFTIADFVADVRATTPTAAAELVAAPMEAWLGALESTAARIGEAMHRAIEGRSQRLDRALARLGRPSGLAAQQRLSLARLEHSCRYAVLSRLQADRAQLLGLARALPDRVQQRLERSANQVASSAARLRLLDPRLVLQRGYAWLADENGRAIVSAIQPVAGQRLTATLVDGEVDLRVLAQRPD
jgi:exodeoxyribonuclease VII large subunit